MARQTITVANFAQCEGWKGPGRYILALVKNNADFEVVSIPRSPGYDGDARRIYPATPETERQLDEIHKPDPEN